MAAVIFRRSREPRLLWIIPMRWIFVQCMAPTIAGLLLVFVIGSWLHPKELYRYHWTCGIVHLPSISRIINMSFERTIFQLIVLFSAPLRLIVLLRHWLEFSNTSGARLITLLRAAMGISGVADVLFLCTLSVIGERENGDIHVMLFAAFAASSYVYFICLVLLTRRSSNGSPEDTLTTKLQLASLSTVSITLPIIILFFVLYNGYCIPFTYELFAAFEYATVIGMYAFHVSSYWKMTGFIYVYHSSIKSRTLRV